MVYETYNYSIHGVYNWVDDDLLKQLIETSWLPGDREAHPKVHRYKPKISQNQGSKDHL